MFFCFISITTTVFSTHAVFFKSFTFFCLLYIQLVHLSDNERKKENKEKYSLKGEETATDDREENRKRIKNDASLLSTPVRHVGKVLEVSLFALGEDARIFGGRQRRLLRRKLLVKVGHVLGGALEGEEKKIKI